MSENPQASVPCPKCRARNDRVVDARGTQAGYIRRRRECISCGHRYTTREGVETHNSDAVMNAVEIVMADAVTRIREAVRLGAEVG